MIEPANSLVSLYGLSWPEFTQFIAEYSAVHHVELSKAFQETYHGVVCANITEHIQLIEADTQVYSPTRAFAYIYGACASWLDLHAYYSSRKYYQPNKRDEELATAYRYISYKIVGDDFELTERLKLCGRLREMCAREQDPLTLDVYRRALEVMETGQERRVPKRRARPGEVVSLAFHELAKLMSGRPIPALFDIDARCRVAWFNVLYACFPCELAKIRVHQKSA